LDTTIWMKDLPNTRWLRQIVMPGSDEPGVYGTSHPVIRALPFVKTSYTLCQHSDFSLQALADSRFFDCRELLNKIPNTERTSPDVKYENRLGHFAKEKVLGS
jgi:hypothetical protein